MRAGGGTALGVGEKVVVRALECLEKLCVSQQCERFMTPLAREVGFTNTARQRKTAAVLIGAL